MTILAKIICLGGMTFLASVAVMAQSSSCAPTEKGGGLQGVNSLTGCPFSATLQIEHRQTLADGTQIRTTTTGALYRDSLGRIRYETKAPMGAGGSVPGASDLIEIFDPVAGVSYFMLPQRSHTADRHTIGQSPAKVTERSSPASPSSPEPEYKQLGTQEIAGVTATGERRTRTIPVDMQGNDRPIMVISETWRSQELGIALLRKVSDPRSGDAEIRVTSLDRSEPDPTLFQVPGDYAIKDPQ